MNKHMRVLAVIVLSSIVGLAGYANGQSSSKADEHRGEVSKFVQELNAIAGRDNNIGPEIRQIAMEQADNASKSSEAIGAIENRNPLVTFLFGTDYRNIGVLRSRLVTSQNHVDRLTKAIDKAKNADIKSDLQAEIERLETTIAEIEQFIKDNESKFSILGWAVKLLSE